MLVELLEGLRILFMGLQELFEFLISFIRICITSNLWPFILISIAIGYLKRQTH